MRYLCRLVTPPSGLILDPFLGSGTTGIAAILEGFQFAGCENNAEYAALAEARIARARQEGVLPMSVPEGREPEAELIAEVKPKEEM
jgi:site-specific DNA-methyltransferase (adenine-specific)